MNRLPFYHRPTGQYQPRLFTRWQVRERTARRWTPWLLAVLFFAVCYLLETLLFH